MDSTYVADLKAGAGAYDSSTESTATDDVSSETALESEDDFSSLGSPESESLLEQPDDETCEESTSTEEHVQATVAESESCRSYLCACAASGCILAFQIVAALIVFVLLALLLVMLCDAIWLACQRQITKDADSALEKTGASYSWTAVSPTASATRIPIVMDRMAVEISRGQALVSHLKFKLSCAETLDLKLSSVA